MSSVRVYLLLIVGVLGLAGCGQDQSPSAAATASASASSDDTSTVEQTRASDEHNNAIHVLVLGNSIAAGRGVSPRQAFPSLLQRKVDSLGWAVEIRNAGVSGETSAGGRQRIGWLLDTPVDVLILELGGNDGLRGIDPQVTKENLTGIIDTTLATYPDAQVLLAGMRVPPNLGSQYTEQFRKIYPSIAETYDRVTGIPFILENVAGVDSLMQSDGIHPNARGHRIVAKNVWSVLRPVLARMQAHEAE